MATGTVTAGRKRRVSSVSVFAAALLVFCLLLAAALPAVSSASGESGDTWEERLAQARERYNKKTVNIYQKGRGRYRRGRINVCFYPSSDKKHVNINIRESLRITDEAEMEAILEVIAGSKDFSSEVYGTISFMKAQWIAHNLAHSMATGSDKERKLIEAITGQSIPDVLGSSQELDLSPLTAMSENEKMLYRFIERYLVHDSGEP